MRIKTSNDSIINVDSTKRSVTIEGVEFGSDCRALVSKNKDGTGTITLIFEGKII
jgi:gp30